MLCVLSVIKSELKLHEFDGAVSEQYDYQYNEIGRLTRSSLNGELRGSYVYDALATEHLSQIMTLGQAFYVFHKKYQYFAE